MLATPGSRLVGGGSPPFSYIEGSTGETTRAVLCLLSNAGIKAPGSWAMVGSGRWPCKYMPFQHRRATDSGLIFTPSPSPLTGSRAPHSSLLSSLFIPQHFLPPSRDPTRPPSFPPSHLPTPLPPSHPPTHPPFIHPSIHPPTHRSIHPSLHYFLRVFL